jgi:hypothetical protein
MLLTCIVIPSILNLRKLGRAKNQEIKAHTTIVFRISSNTPTCKEQRLYK